jgi:hypothetical protein
MTKYITSYVAPKPKTLSINELAVAVLIFCATTQRELPRGVDKSLDRINPNDFKEPYKSLLEMWRRRTGNVMEEIEVIYSILLPKAIKDSRMENKDFAPKSPDIYDSLEV